MSCLIKPFQFNALRPLGPRRNQRGSLQTAAIFRPHHSIGSRPALCTFRSVRIAQARDAWPSDEAKVPSVLKILSPSFKSRSQVICLGTEGVTVKLVRCNYKKLSSPIQQYDDMMQSKQAAQQIPRACSALSLRQQHPQLLSQSQPCIAAAHDLPMRSCCKSGRRCVYIVLDILPYANDIRSI